MSNFKIAGLIFSGTIGFILGVKFGWIALIYSALFGFAIGIFIDILEDHYGEKN